MRWAGAYRGIVGYVPWWGVAAATASPLVLVGGWTLAAMLQPPSFSQVADTVSALAAPGATDPWVMTMVFVVVGACDVVTGVALRPAARAGRMILIAGAVAGMLVAANPEHAGAGHLAARGDRFLPRWMGQPAKPAG